LSLIPDLDIGKTDFAFSTAREAAGRVHSRYRGLNWQPAHGTCRQADALYLKEGGGSLGEGNWLCAWSSIIWAIDDGKSGLGIRQCLLIVPTQALLLSEVRADTHGWRERERFTSSPTFLCGNTPATLG